MADDKITREVLNALTSHRMDAGQQARILIRAMDRFIKSHKKLKFSTVQRMYAELTGPGITKKKMSREDHLTGDAGEVVLYNGVKIFFQNQKVRERYGYGYVTEQMDVMVSAEGYNKNVNFPKYKDRWVAEAKKIFTNVILGGRAGNSMTDFFWQHGRPVDSKAKLYARIVDGKIKSYSSEADKAKLSNEYIKELADTPGGVIIGFTWMSVIYKEVLLNQRDSKLAKKNITKAAERLGKQTGQPHTIGRRVGAEFDKIYKAVAVQLEGFMPLIIQDGKLNAELQKRIDLAETNTDRVMERKVVENNVRHIENLINKYRAARKAMNKK